MKEGKGTISTESGAVRNVAYAFTNRFENTPGTNPEELIAAAHAGCFSMAFSNELAKATFKPEQVNTTCAITFEKVGESWTITESHLTVRARVGGATPQQVQEKAEAAKKGCPVSRALNCKVTLDLTVEGTAASGMAAAQRAH